jgi:hypothetical protein
VSTVYQQIMYREAVRAQRERDIAEGLRAQQASQASIPLRRAVGLSIMKVGARLAAEPPPRPARSR